MRILQINAVNGIASTGRTTYELANFLNKKKDFKCYIVYSNGKPVKYGYKIGNNFEKKIHALFSRLIGLQGYFSHFSTKRLLSYIKSEQIDIVHLRNLHSNYINIPMLLGFLAKNNISTVITLHDCFFYTGKCCHYTSNNCYKWKTECNNCNFIHSYNNSWFFDRTKKIWHDKKKLFSNISNLAVIGVSDWITNEAKQSFLSNAKILKRIYNWVDLDIFKPVDYTSLKISLGLNDKFIILGVASTFSTSKGLLEFIDIANKIDDSFCIILIGKISNIKLPDNIIHIDNITDVYELAKYYSMANIFINFSLEETFGKVSAEALSCGTPVICYNSTANSEIIGENCGYVVEQKNIKSIIDCVNKIKEKGKDFYSMYCIDYAQQNFDKNKNMEEYLYLYKQLLEINNDR